MFLSNRLECRMYGTSPICKFALPCYNVVGFQSRYRGDNMSVGKGKYRKVYPVKKAKTSDV